MFRLIPREMKFFELFAELSSNLTEGAKLLRSILENPVDLGVRAEQMQAIEHKGDKATHAIITKLNQTFITPFDREDIYRLEHCDEVNRLEDVADHVSRKAIADLFEHEKDPIHLIKIKELYEVLETATDKAEDAANVLEAIVLKSA